MNLDMKKVVLIATSLLLIACGEKSTDDLIKDKNITELKNRKAAIQSELEKIASNNNELNALINNCTADKNDSSVIKNISVNDWEFENNSIISIDTPLPINENILCN